MILPYLPCFTWSFLLFDSIKFFLCSHPCPKQCMFDIWEIWHGQFSWEVYLHFYYSKSEQFLTWICYCVFNQKEVSTGYFEFLFWFTSVILLSKIKSLFLNLYTSPQWVTSRHSLFQLPFTTGSVYEFTNYKISANEILISNSNVRGYWFPK